MALFVGLTYRGAGVLLVEGAMMANPYTMTLCLHRYQFRQQDTMGELRVDYHDGRGSQWFGWVVEDTDRGLHMSDSLEHIQQVKVPGQTAIPAGCYDLELVYSGKFGPDTLSLVDVPGFRYIRVHTGSHEGHTEGCIMAGMKRDDVEGSISNSGAAVDWLEDTIRPLLRDGQRVRIYIDREPTAWAARLREAT